MEGGGAAAGWLPPDVFEDIVVTAAEGLALLRDEEADAAAVASSSADGLEKFGEGSEVLLALCLQDEAVNDARTPLPETPAVSDALDTLASLIMGGAAGTGAAPKSCSFALQVVAGLARNSPVRAAALARRAPLAEALAAAPAALRARGDAGACCIAATAALAVLQETVWPEHRAAWAAPESAANLRALAAGVAGGVSGTAALMPRDVFALLSDTACAALAHALLTACPAPEDLAREVLLVEGFGDALCTAVAECSRCMPSTRVDAGADSLPGQGTLTLLAALCGGVLRIEGSARTRTWLSFVDIAATASLAEQPPALELLLSRAPALPARLAGVLSAARAWCNATVRACGALDARRARGAAARPRAVPAQQRRGGTPLGDRGATPLAEGLGRPNSEVLQFAVAALSGMAPALAARDGLVARLAPALLDLARAGTALAAAWPELGGRADEAKRDGAALSAMGAVRALRRLIAPSAADALVARAPGVVADLLRLAALPPLRGAGSKAAMAQHALCADAAHTLATLLGAPAPAAGARDGSDGDAAAPAAALEMLAAAVRAEPELLVALGAAAGRDARNAAGASAGGALPPEIVERRAAAAQVLALAVPAMARGGGAGGSGAGGGSNGGGDGGGAWLTPLAT